MKTKTHKEFYENGTLKRSVQKNEENKIHGIEQTFYKNGKLKSREKFDNGITVFRRVYWPNGQMQEQFGKINGQWVHKLRNGRGKLVSHNTFSEEVLRSRKLFTIFYRAFSIKSWEINKMDRDKKRNRVNSPQ